MGISEDGLDGGAAVDGTVGAIVWVRRRNGSWWPGRILGPEELPASHVVSPRSGTPVKLLGREDASVDWYNLEKSKRVKAFRCGEFDACIERAEASQGITIKKREKYARREDAILHALELERKHFGINQIKLGLSGSSRGEFSSFQSEVYLRNDEPVIHSKIAPQISQPVSRKGALSHEYNDRHRTIDSFYEYKGICDNRLDWKEDALDIMPWIREEKDFSLQIASPSRKSSALVAWETSGEHIDNSMEVFSIAEHIVGGVSHIGRSGCASSTKRKRSQGGIIEDSPVKKSDKSRKLVPVVQSSEDLPFSHSFPSGYDTGVTSMQCENAHTGVVSQSERSRCVYVAADSNDLMDHNGHYSEEMTIMGSQFGMDHYLHYPAPLVEECTSSGLIEATESDSSGRGLWETELKEGKLLTDRPPALLPGARHCDPYEFQAPDEFEKRPSDETYLSKWYIHEQDGDASTDIRVSKWNMKGKRNSRLSAKRHKSMKDQKVSNNAEKYNGSAMGTTSSYRTGKVVPSCRRNSELGLYHKREPGHTYDGHDLTDKDFGPYQLAAHVNRRYPFPLQESKDSGKFHTSFGDSNNDYHSVHHSGWEADLPSRVSKRAYWEESHEPFEPIYASHINDRTESMLVDVDLKVQARYQGEHVPLVSLMSRLNGKAIIGHPLQIEVLEDGSSCQLVSRNETGVNRSSTPPAVWRTARRTTMQRVPRVNPVSAFEGEVTKPPEYLEQESNHLYTKFYSGHSEHLMKSAKRSISYPHRPLLGKSPKKVPRKMSSSNQKTRMLASIAPQHKVMGEKDEVKMCRADDILGGLIKPEGAVPLVTCLPMKVVFSRILEAIGRPGSAVPRIRMP